MSSPDTSNSMITNAHNLTGMLDWHPAFYCMVLRVILKVWDSTYAVILVQYFFWGYVMTEGLLYLRKKGMRDNFLLIIAFFSGINSGNFVHLDTIWKDIPYTLSITWIVILLARLILDFETYRKKWYIYIELSIALIGTYFYRKNGVVTFAVVLIIMLFVFFRNIRVLCALAVVVAFIFMVKGPVYSYFQIVDSGRYGMYIGLSQDILGVYYAEGEVSEETLQMINVITDYDSAEYYYTPTWSVQSYELAVEPVKFIINYIDTFIKNPVIMVRAVIAREDVLWNIFVGYEARQNCVDWTATMDGQGEWNDYYPVHKYNGFNPYISLLLSYTINSQWISALEWRSGIFVLLGTIVIFLFICVKGVKKDIVILVPVVGHILSLLLSTGWSDFRYFWPLNLMNLFVLLFVMIFLQNEENDSEE